MPADDLIPTRADCCGARAVSSYHGPLTVWQVLRFCAHHERRHARALRAAGWTKASSNVQARQTSAPSRALGR